MKTLLAAFALAAASLATGQAVAAPIVAAPAKPLDRLVALLTPQDALLGLAGHAFEKSLDRELSAGTKKRYPGLKAYVADALRPAFLKTLKKEIPSLRREIRAVAADRLTAAEIAEALKFFSSPTGIKLRTQVYATLAEKPNLSAEDTQAAVMSAVMKNMKIGDYPALMTFGASSAAAKLNTINPRITEVSRAWSDRLVAKYSTRMRSLAAAATKRYLKGRK